MVSGGHGHSQFGAQSCCLCLFTLECGGRDLFFTDHVYFLLIICFHISLSMYFIVEDVLRNRTQTFV